MDRAGVYGLHMSPSRGALGETTTKNGPLNKTAKNTLFIFVHGFWLQNGANIDPKIYKTSSSGRDGRPEPPASHRREHALAGSARFVPKWFRGITCTIWLNFKIRDRGSAWFFGAHILYLVPGINCLDRGGPTI